MSGPTIFDDIAKDVDVTLQCLEALEAMIHIAEDTQDNDVDPLQNSTELCDTSKISKRSWSYWS